MKHHIPLIVLLLSSPTLAHDSWVETDRPAVAPGKPVRIDLKLGNHGNDHRDFKIMGLVDLDSSTLQLIAPDRSGRDLKPQLQRTGEGEATWWTLTVAPDQSGVWTVASTSDKVVTYAPKRSIKSAKTYVTVGATAGSGRELSEAPLGHVMELVPGRDGEVTLLFKGRPLANHRVSCIPRGTTLKEGFDEEHERMTDEQGRAAFPLPVGTTCLIVAHHEDRDHGEGYDSTKYSATLTVSRLSE